MYTGCLDCTVADQGGKLYGLLQLCSEYALPMPLQEFAQKRLVRLVADPMSSAVIPLLLCGESMRTLSPKERQFVACQFFGREAAWHSCTNGTRNQVLELALEMLEACIEGSQSGGTVNGTSSVPDPLSMSMPSGMHSDRMNMSLADPMGMSRMGVDAMNMSRMDPMSMSRMGVDAMSMSRMDPMNMSMSRSMSMPNSMQMPNADPMSMSMTDQMAMSLGGPAACSSMRRPSPDHGIESIPEGGYRGPSSAPLESLPMSMRAGYGDPMAMSMGGMTSGMQMSGNPAGWRATYDQAGMVDPMSRSMSMRLPGPGPCSGETYDQAGMVDPTSRSMSMRLPSPGPCQGETYDQAG